jgi:hypothetical protein
VQLVASLKELNGLEFLGMRDQNHMLSPRSKSPKGNDVCNSSGLGPVLFLWRMHGKSLVVWFVQVLLTIDHFQPWISMGRCLDTSYSGENSAKPT